MVRLNGRRILGYESGFDSAGRGLDALAEAGQIQNERQRQGVQDQQTAEAHTQLIQQLALKNKELQDKLDQLPKQHAQEQQVFDAGMQDRQRKIAQEDAQRAAMSGLGNVLAGGQVDQRDPQLFYDSAGASKAFGQGDPTTQDQPDAHPDLQNHLDETQNILKGVAPLLKDLPSHVQNSLITSIYNQRATGMGEILKSESLGMLKQLRGSETVDDQFVQNATDVLGSNDPRKIQQLYTNLAQLQKGVKNDAADQNVIQNTAMRVDEMIAGAPHAGIHLTDDQESEIEDLRQDIAHAKTPAEARSARDKIRKILFGSDGSGSGKRGKAWHDSPAFLKILELNGGDVGKSMDQARQMGIEGVPAPPPPDPRVAHDAQVASALADQLGRKPTEQELVPALRQLDQQQGAQPQAQQPQQAAPSAPAAAPQEAPFPQGGIYPNQLIGGQTPEQIIAQYESRPQIARPKAQEDSDRAIYEQAKAALAARAPSNAPAPTSKDASRVLDRVAPRVLTEGEARALHAQDPNVKLKQVPGGYIQVK
jgi:hypothetical protein